MEREPAVLEPYRAPQAELREPQATRRRSSIAAVLLGGLVVDVIGGTLLQMIALLAWAAGRTALGGSADEIAAAMTGSGLLAAATLLGAAMALAGGYVAARWAGRRPIAHALGAGLVGLVVGSSSLLIPAPEVPAWLVAASFAIHLPTAAAGGGLAARRAALEPAPATR